MTAKSTRAARPDGFAGGLAATAGAWAAAMVLCGPAAVALLGASSLSAAASQDAIIPRPPAEIESLLADAEFDVTGRKTIRPGRHRTDLVILDFGDRRQLPAKWIRAPDGGHEWNNAPRYELAAYEIQKLFLDPDDYVVPPTVCRCFGPVRYAELTGREDPPDPTFEGTDCVLTVLQFWLQNVTTEGVWDEDRMRSDEPYARHLSNLDVLTYLVDHKDANTGNFLISTLAANPRVFVVDNGISFRARRSPRGYQWRWLRVDRIPGTTAERLKAVTLEGLRDRLGVLVQYRALGDTLRRVQPAGNLDPDRGVRVADGVIQLGLEDREIEDLYDRIRDLVGRLDSGTIRTF